MNPTTTRSLIASLLTAAMAALSLACFSLSSPVHAAVLPPGYAQLTGSLPRVQLATAGPVGALPDDKQIRLAITLPLRNRAGLQNFLQRLYTPGDPLYKRYITPQQFADRYGPTQDDYDAVAAYFASQGFSVTKRYTSRTILDVMADSATNERAFGVSMKQYRDVDGHVFYAPDREPAVPVEIASKIVGIIGLNNAVTPRPNIHAVEPSLAAAIQPDANSFFGTGIDGFLAPADIFKVYSMPETLTQLPYGATEPLDGTGQNIGLVELDGFYESDVLVFDNQYLGNYPAIDYVLLDGVDGTPQTPSGQEEATSDVEWIDAVAPGNYSLYIYEGSDDESGLVDVLTQMANDHSTTTISTSWSVSEYLESGNDSIAFENALNQMAAQGQTFCAASGDNGAFGEPKDPGVVTVEEPSSQPYALGVGGTTLSDTSTETYSKEVTWNSGIENGLLVASGGGISGEYSIPSYQTGMVGQSSTTQRNVPDVCLNASDKSGYSIYLNGTWQGVSGTSIASPIWAGYLDIASALLAEKSYPVLGSVNPKLYATRSDPDYDFLFHDITVGGNGVYNATTAYDNATGLGSFQGDHLFFYLADSVPEAPSPLTATYNNTAVTLKWPLAFGATYYEVTRSIDGGSELNVYAGYGDKTTVGDGDIRPGDTNTYQVFATNFWGSTYSNTASVTAAPPPPASLTAAPSDTSITLSWPSSNGATQYNIYRSYGGGGFNSLTKTSSNFYIDSAVAEGVTYSYEVEAINKRGSSPPSPIATAALTPAAPTNLAATAYYDQIGLSWTQVATATGYNVYRSNDGTTYTLIASPSGTQNTSYTDSSVVDTQFYYYYVTATASSSESARSNTVGLYPSGPLPGTPIIDNVSSTGTTVTLQWTAASNVIGYYVYRSTSNNQGTFQLVGLPGSNRTYSDSGLTTGTEYYYEVKADNGAGFGPPSNIVDAYPGSPGAPTGLQATASNAYVALSWNAVPGATSYSLYRSLSSGSGYVLQAAGDTDTNIGDANVNDGTTYYYVVTATDSNGESWYSNEAVATPTGSPPTAPAGVSAYPYNGYVTVSWEAESGVTTYQVFESTDGTTFKGATPTTGTTLSFYRLTDNKPYFFYVTASINLLTSPPSPTVTAYPIASKLAITSGPGLSTDSRGFLQASWATNGFADSVLLYGTSKTSLSTSEQSSTYVESHTLVFGALRSRVTYYYEVRSYDGDEPVTSSILSFVAP